MRSFAGDFFKLKLREKWLPHGNEAAIKSPKYMVLAKLEIIKKRKKIIVFLLRVLRRRNSLQDYTTTGKNATFTLHHGKFCLLVGA